MKTPESRVMLEAAMLKRDALDRVVSSDDRHTLIKMWQFMMDAMKAAQREARAEAFKEAMHHIYCRMGARSTPLEIIAALKELAAQDPK